MIQDTRYKLQDTSQSGYMALMSAIIIAGVLMAVVFTMGFKSFMTRFNLLDTEYKKTSLNLAEACANTAILKLIGDNSYTVPSGGESVTINGNDCLIFSVSPVGSQYLIQSRAVVKKAVSNIEVTLDSDFSIARWREVTNL